MTSRGRRVSVQIAGDADQLQREFSRLRREISDVDKELSRMGLGGTATANREATTLTRTLGGLRSNYLAIGAAAGVATVAIGGGVAVVRQLADAASNLQESQSKANVVFGDSVEVVNRFSESSATSFGISRQAALEAAGAYGNMFNTIGLAQDASASMSVTMVQLAADMASFNNQDPGEMLLKLRSGLAGEAEPLRQFGVLLSEAAVKEEAYASGIAKRGAELTEAEKVQARFNLIMRQTAIQQGDVARTSDGLANQQRQLAAQVDNLQAKIGQALLPYVEDLTKEMNKWIETNGDEFAEDLAGFVEDAVEATRDLIGLTGDVIGFAAAVAGAASDADRLANNLARAVAAAAGAVVPGSDPDKTMGPLEFFATGALAPFRAAGAAIGGIGAALGQATDFRPSEETFRLYATNPELFNDFQAAEIEKYMPGRRAAADAVMAMLSPDRANILRQRARWGGLGSEDDLYGFTGYDAPNPRTSGDEEEKTGKGGAGPTAYSAEDLAFIERAVGGLSRAGWLPSSLQEFEAMQATFDARRRDLNRTLSELGLEMADLDARGQEQTETYAELKGRVEAAQDALKRIDLVEDLRLEPFRDAMKEAREAVEALTKAEKERYDDARRQAQALEGTAIGMSGDAGPSAFWTARFGNLLQEFAGIGTFADVGPNLDLLLPLLGASGPAANVNGAYGSGPTTIQAGALAGFSGKAEELLERILNAIEDGTDIAVTVASGDSGGLLNLGAGVGP